MTDIERLNELGLDRLGEGKNVSQDEIIQLEKKLSIFLPETLKSMLIEYGCPIVFNKEVGFRPIENTGLEGPDGLISVELIYGIGLGRYDIDLMNDTFADRIPDHLCPIALCPGGNQLLLDINDKSIVFWKHDTCENEKNLWLVGQNFSDFCNRLDEIKSTGNRGAGVVKEGSYLDF